ncbi:unnamed protein product [marine sediment metagenome]|uniref:Uncharacterized protein n=1 Tax=marine sediment metagenome TaxID=412755 RepID=X1HI21_9ZZZZ
MGYVSRTISGTQLLDALSVSGIKLDSIILNGLLTLAEFQTTPGTGTVSNPERINDGLTDAGFFATEIGQYVEVEFPRRWCNTRRMYGDISNNEDGWWQFKYWDGAAWRHR